MFNWLTNKARFRNNDGLHVFYEGHPAVMKVEDVVEGLAIWDTLKVGPGPGIDGIALIAEWGIKRYGNVIETTLTLDLTGLNSGGTAGDVIGDDGTGAAYLGRIDTDKMGTLFAAEIRCIETPAGGDTDFDVYSATEATGVEDTAISVLTETQLVNAGAHSAGSQDPFTALPANNAYLYLVGQGTSNATYTAGIFQIRFYGLVDG